MLGRLNSVCFISVISLSSAGCGRSAADYLAKGNSYAKSAKYEAAAIQYQKAIQKDPKSGEAYYRLGLVEIDQNDGVEAYRTLNQAVQLSPDNIAAKARLADVSLALYVALPDRPQGLYVQAGELAGQLLAKTPNSFDGLRLKGSLLLLDQKPKEAIALFEKANLIEPMRPDLVESWVQALFLDNRGPDGERLAAQLIDKDKTFGPMYDVLYRQYLATNRPADAENILKMKCANNPKDATSVFQLARHYASAQKFAEMNSSIRLVLDHPGDFPDGRLQAGDFLVSVGRQDEAFQTFEEGARSSPKDKLTYLKRMADTRIAQAKPDEAADLVERILRDAPKDYDARLVRATLWLDSGAPNKLAATLTELRQLSTEKPDDARTRFLLGRACLAQGDSEGARNEFMQVIRLRPDDLPSRFALAAISLSQQKPDEALRYAEEILARDGTNDRARLLRAAAMVSSGRLEEPRVELRRLLQQYPNSKEVQFQAALLAIGEKNFSEAERVLRKLNESTPGDPRLGAALVEAYSMQGQMERAIDTLNECLKTAPGSVPIRRLLAITETNARKYDLAAADYQRVLAADPKSIDDRLQLGEVYHLKGDLNNAIAVLEQACQLAPKDPEPLMSMAAMLENAGRNAEAQKGYRRVLEMRPDNPFVLNNIAFLMVETGGDPDEALGLALRARQKAPEHSFITDTVGWIYLKKGMKDTAIQTFSTLVRREPRNAVFHYHLAVALQEQGDRQKAKLEAQTALECSETPEVTEKIKGFLGTIG